MSISRCERRLYKTPLIQFFESLAASVLITTHGRTRGGRLRGYRQTIAALATFLKRAPVTGDLTAAQIADYRASLSGGTRARRIERLNAIAELAAEMGFVPPKEPDDQDNVTPSSVDRPTCLNDIDAAFESFDNEFAELTGELESIERGEPLRRRRQVVRFDDHAIARAAIAARRTAMVIRSNAGPAWFAGPLQSAAGDGVAVWPAPSPSFLLPGRSVRGIPPPLDRASQRDSHALSARRPAENEKRFRGNDGIARGRFHGNAVIETNSHIH